MKRAGCIILMALLAILIFPVPNPYPYSIPADRVNDPFEAPFLTAADGDVSSESIGEEYSHKLRETLSEDVLFYPDAFLNDTAQTASAGFAGPVEFSTLDETYTVDDTPYWSGTTGVGDARVILNFTSSNQIEGFDYAIKAKGWHDDDSCNLWNYDFVADDWELICSGVIGTYTWENGTFWDSGESYSKVMLKYNSTDADNIENACVDYAEVKFHYMTLADSNHYADSFADVSDCAGSSGVSVSTDGDVVRAEQAGDLVYRYLFVNGISMTSAEGLYLEVRVWGNGTSGSIKFYTGEVDSGGSLTLLSGTSAYTTTPITHIFYISHSNPVECIAMRFKDDEATSLYSDYVRVAPSTEMGWQHDFSTTTGISSADGGTIASDSDVVTLTADGDGSTFLIVADTTATATAISCTYYPMLGIDIDSGSGSWTLEQYDGSAYATLQTSTAISAGTKRFNMRALDTYVSWWRITLTASGVFVSDWAKAFSIANFTVNPNPNVANVVYVESGELVIDTDTDAGTLTFDYDPAVSVATATYPVWNFTSSTGFDLTGGLDFSFKPTVGGSEGNYGDETRGTWTGLSGTLTNIGFWVRTAVTIRISAIKFWEDATAPTMTDKWVNPPEPYDDESTTITVAATDGVDVYTVKLNAETYPPGFSDVDYTMTESVDNALYKYTFSGMTAGYYEFAITVDDGANTYTEYIPLTVRESEISVNSISLFGAGDDFDYMHWSFKINKDCTYVIREWSENVGASDTFSGSVAEGVRNIAWEKLSTEDTKVNFTVTFTNASLTYVFDSSYEVAQTALSITGDESISQDEIVYSGTSTKACSWTLYLDSVQEDTGSIAAAGSFVVNWTRTQNIDPSSISFAIKFYTATETVWENGTYSEYSLTAFSIQTLFMDLTDPSISAIFTTSWGNATGYLYEADVQKATGAEGTTLSYTKSTTAGTYSVALKIDAGGEVAWYNTTYSVSAEDTLSITALSYDSSGPNVSIFVNTNWGNCTLTVYENEVQQATGSEGTLSYLKATSAGDYNISVKIDGTADSLWANYTYTVAAESALIINTLILDKSGPNITTFVATNWGNCTITVYQDNVQKDSDSESVTLSYAQSTAAGTYAIAIKIDGGASTLWHNDSYTVTVTALEVTEHISFSDDWINFFYITNRANGTFYIWDNDTLVGGSLEGWYQVAKPTTVGLHNFTILVNATQGTIDTSSQSKAGYPTDDAWEWKNFEFTVNPVTLSMTSLIVQQNNISIVVGGFFHTPDLTLAWEAFEAGVSIDTGTLVLSASGEYNSIYWEKATITELKNFTLTISAGTSSLNINAYSLVIDSATYITTNTASSFEEGDYYLNNTYYAAEKPIGVFIDQGTATIISVGGFLLVFVAYLAERELRKREILKTERLYGS